MIMYNPPELRTGRYEPPVGNTCAGLSHYSGARGIYARVSVDYKSMGISACAGSEVDTLKNIQHILSSNGISDYSMSDDLHITIAHSTKSTISYLRLGAELSEHLYATVRYGYRLKELSYCRGDSGKGYLILDVDSDELHRLHSSFRYLGATHAYAGYRPHITIAQEVGPLDLRLIKCIDNTNLALSRDGIYGNLMYAANLKCSDLHRWPYSGA